MKKLVGIALFVSALGGCDPIIKPALYPIREKFILSHEGVNYCLSYEDYGVPGRRDWDVPEPFIEKEIRPCVSSRYRSW